MKHHNQYIKHGLVGLFIGISLLAVPGCKKSVEVTTPNTSLISSTAFSDPKTATAVMTGIYDNMHSNSSFTDGTAGISTYMGTAADEMKNYYPGIVSIQFYTNGLTATPSSYFWPQFFSIHLRG